MKVFFSILALLGLQMSYAQVTNDQINFDLRVKRITQFFDNDNITDDDNFVKITTEFPAFNNTYITPVNNGDNICGGIWFDYFWEEDAQAYRSPAYGSPSGYQRFVEQTNRANSNSVNFHIRTWEEDGAWSCTEQEGNNSGEWAGWEQYFFKQNDSDIAGYKSSEWRDIGWISDDWVVTWGGDRYGDAQFRSTWRYTHGNTFADPLTFGQISTERRHINANRVAPTNAQAFTGYTNESGQSSPDVFYSFSLDGPYAVTISTNTNRTNFDTFITLMNSTGDFISDNDDIGGGNTKSELETNLTAGTYFVRVEGFNGNIGDFELVITPVSSLPIELISFSGYNENRQNFLNWSTASEMNNEKFEIERSNNPQNGFEKIGEVQGAGNSIETISYQFIDENLLNGTNYYRLRQIDYDGQFEYSAIIAINNEFGSEFNIYPNVATKEVTVNFNQTHPSEFIFVLSDVTGRKMVQELYPVEKGNNSIVLDISKFNGGTYFLSIFEDDQIILGSKKIIKQ